MNSLENARYVLYVCLPTVDGDYLPGSIAGSITSEKHHHRTQIFVGVTLLLTHRNRLMVLPDASCFLLFFQVKRSFNVHMRRHC